MSSSPLRKDRNHEPLLGPGIGSRSCTRLADPADLFDGAKRLVLLGFTESSLVAAVGWGSRIGLSMVPDPMARSGISSELVVTLTEDRRLADIQVTSLA